MQFISRFKEEYEFLNNYYPCPVEYEGITYPTNEHAFQAVKTLNKSLRAEIANAATPGIAKEMGNQVSLRPDWEEIKTDVMLELCRKKFSVPDLKQKLLATEGCYLVEGNHWGDRCWGVVNGVGENRLGQILMHIRSDLSNDTITPFILHAQKTQGSKIHSKSERTR